MSTNTECPQPEGGYTPDFLHPVEISVQLQIGLALAGDVPTINASELVTKPGFRGFVDISANCLSDLSERKAQFTSSGARALRDFYMAVKALGSQQPSTAGFAQCQRRLSCAAYAARELQAARRLLSRDEGRSWESRGSPVVRNREA